MKAFSQSCIYGYLVDVLKSTKSMLAGDPVTALQLLTGISRGQGFAGASGISIPPMHPRMWDTLQDLLASEVEGT